MVRVDGNAGRQGGTHDQGRAFPVERVRARGDANRQAALKLVANATTGLLNDAASSLYSPDAYSGITLCGRKALVALRRACQRFGKVLCENTDGVTVELDSEHRIADGDDGSGAAAIVKDAFVEELTELLDAELAREMAAAGNDESAEMTRIIGSQHRPTAPSFNGKRVAFRMMLAPYAGDGPDEILRSEAALFSFPPAAVRIEKNSRELVHGLPFEEELAAAIEEHGLDACKGWFYADLLAERNKDLKPGVPTEEQGAGLATFIRLIVEGIKMRP